MSFCSGRIFLIKLFYIFANSWVRIKIINRNNIEIYILPPIFKI